MSETLPKRGNRPPGNRQIVEAGLARRYRRERGFRLLGLLATAVGVSFLLVFFWTIMSQGATAFVQTFVTLDVSLDEAVLWPDGNAGQSPANYDAVVRQALLARFPEARDRQSRRELMRIVSVGAAYQMREMLEQDPALLGERRRVAVPVSANVDMLIKGSVDPELAESRRLLSDRQIAWVRSLQQSGEIRTRFNNALFSNGDSREPELAGIRGALKGSLYMLLVTILLSFPVGAAAAVYLEEFAPRNRWTDIIEININNLAAVPSIVFGLLGLAVFINWLALPRSSPLVGGLVLSLVTLPVIIIAARSAIQAVPMSIRDGAIGLGASRMQVVFHHILPIAMPGMLTGAIISIGRALGETAPLLMIGMVAFIVDVPGRVTDPSTALPVQVYLWAGSPERAFAERTSAAILILLGFLLAVNLVAVLLRKHLERRR